MRWLLFIPACALDVSTVLAQVANTDAEIPLTPPAYKMLRFDEDYSCLTNQANRTDLFDPVKYIPFRKDDPLWYLSFGGELRERVEGNYDPNFFDRQGGRRLVPVATHNTVGRWT